MNPTPAQNVAQAIIRRIHALMHVHGLNSEWQFGESVEFLQQDMADLIQQVADEQSQQSDAQAFGDDLEVAVQGIEQCDCYSRGADLIVTVHPLFPYQPTHGAN